MANSRPPGSVCMAVPENLSLFLAVPQVRGPTIPSAVSRWACCHLRVADFVIEPKTPSIPEAPHFARYPSAHRMDCQAPTWLPLVTHGTVAQSVSTFVQR